MKNEQAEPVGYFVNDESDDQWHQVDYEQRNGADTYPLYLHPPADEVQRLRDAARAEVDALRADAERWRYINERNGEWRRFEADGTAPAYSMLCVRLPYDADLSCRATREIAIDDARTEQGLTNPK